MAMTRQSPSQRLVAPIRLISIGGALAVRVCHNREASYDIDCMLDPNIAASSE
ncbi:hypothetical protein MYCTH_2293935 [Thermothelomyces thermophilus ATCC 42464]|uniref:Uncharacterized protein n=1 Tax=Thermothelomyces thermophilus (strain ATCC 42464 / BCRC 31852 / DSM 1799) TaxID=573729 RepID=G2Q6P0_THET4|nr:uncharacterized protein MYCTH_2293935 [Thermothelomyces thermophilus ATCC 42464]AEO53070.1 hypothetical protein MYCTH_2293935 [Thermothelomyces thermophilus ATCC 42464]